MPNESFWDRLVDGCNLSAVVIAIVSFHVESVSANWRPSAASDFTDGSSGFSDLALAAYGKSARAWAK